MSNVDNIKTYAVIPSAGSGQRFGDCRPKQYAIICEKPLIFHTITAFLRIKCMDKIIVVTDSQNRQLMQEIIDSFNHQNRIDLVDGSTSRHRSIANGIQWIANNELPIPDVVVIHDGARPILEEQVVIQLVSSALKYGASGVVCKLTSTVLSVTNDRFLDKALDRNIHYMSETPQAFKYENIKEAYNKCSQHEYDFNTECLDLVQRYTGSKVKLIEVSPNQYFKVTFKKDIYSADGLLKDMRDVLLLCDFQSESQVNYLFINDLRENLEKTSTNVKFFNNSSAVKMAYNQLIVRILLQFCDSWKDILKKNISKCDSLIYLIVTTDPNIDSSNQEITIWAKNKTVDIKRFYAIHSPIEDLDRNRERIIKTILFLSKHSPIELSGQIFFI